MIKKSIFIISSIILIILGFLVGVSATHLPNANPRLCEDFDGGVHPETASFVLASKNILAKPRILRDVCTGEKSRRVDNNGETFTAYSQIKEGSCDAAGKPVANTIDVTNGFCKMMELENTGLPGRNLFGVVVSDAGPKCTKTERGVVSEGVLYQDSCIDNHFVSYSCDNENLEKKDKDCSILGEFGRCDKDRGCVGDCSETDPENDINVPGIATVQNGVQFFDTCNDNKDKIEQYACVNGEAKLVGGNNPWTSCGADRVCVVDVNGAAKCVDKTNAGETITLEGLRKIVAALQARIDALEQKLAALTPTA